MLDDCEDVIDANEDATSVAFVVGFECCILDDDDDDAGVTADTAFDSRCNGTPALVVVTGAPICGNVCAVRGFGGGGRLPPRMLLIKSVSVMPRRISISESLPSRTFKTPVCIVVVV